MLKVSVCTSSESCLQVKHFYSVVRVYKDGNLATHHLWSAFVTVQSTEHAPKGFSPQYTVWQVLISVKMLLGNSTPKCCSLTTSRWNNCRCIVFGCRVLWAGFNSDSLPILQLLSSGRTGKMVKKVCPCNQLCSNYLSFWSSVPPSITSSIPALALPSLPPALECPLDLNSDRFEISSLQLFHPRCLTEMSCVQVWHLKKSKSSNLRTEMTELTCHHRFKLTVHAPTSTHTHTS